MGLCSAAPVSADVFRCEDPELGIVFQQTPCLESGPDAADEAETPAAADAGDAGLEQHAAGQEPEQDAEAPEPDSAAVQACKKRYRDAIDAIDLEIRNAYTPEQKDYYLGRLKVLTDQLRDC